MKKFLFYSFILFAAFLQASLPSTITIHLNNGKSVIISQSKSNQLSSVSKVVKEAVQDSFLKNEISLTRVDKRSFEFIIGLLDRLMLSEELSVRLNNFRKQYGDAEFLQLATSLEYLDIQPLINAYQFLSTSVGKSIETTEKIACTVSQENVFSVKIPYELAKKTLVLRIINSSGTLKDLFKDMGYKKVLNIPVGMEIPLGEVTEAQWKALIKLSSMTPIKEIKISVTPQQLDRFSIAQLTELMTATNYLNMADLLKLIEQVFVKKITAPAFLSKLNKDPNLLFEATQTLVPDLKKNLHAQIIESFPDLSKLGWNKSRSLKFTPVVMTQKEGQPVSSISSEMRVVAFDDEGARIATGLTNNLIIIWDVETGEQLKVIETSGAVNSLVSGGSILAAGIHNGDIMIFDWKSGKLLHTLNNGEKDTENPLAITAAGNLLASRSVNNRIIIWNPQTGKIVHEFPSASKVISFSFNRAGNFLVTGQQDDKFILWNFAIDEMSEHYLPFLQKAIFDPVSDEIAIISKNGLQFFYDDTYYAESLGGTYNALIAFNADGSLLALVNINNNIVILKRGTSELITLPISGLKIYDIAFNRNHQLASALGKEGVIIWETLVTYLHKISLEQLLLVTYIFKVKPKIMPLLFKDLFESLPKPLQQRLREEFGLKL